MVYYFSGQGNSRAAALLLARELHQPAVSITRATLDAAATATPPEANRPNVWVFPVHAWGVPRPVGQYISRLASGSDGSSGESVHHMVATCGDDIGLTDRLWAKAIRRRGWRVGGIFSVAMPNTYVCLPGFDVDPAELAAAKLTAAAPSLTAIAQRIAEGRADGVRSVVAGSFPWLKSCVLRPLFNAFLMSPRGFHADLSRCDGCGTCAALCPMANIAMEAHRPRWGGDCTMCLACYHRCPREAVGYRRMTSGKGHQRTGGLA